MPLIPEPGNPALWLDPERKDRGGTYAVIIGSSRYTHLENGPGPLARKTYGFGQTPVSAFTAYRMFEWLAGRYMYSSAPLAACWLLLSPTDEEVALEPSIGAAPPATFAECEKALLQWGRTMRELHPDEAAKSRALFFFSGHGMELTQEHQVLMPADYLVGEGNLNRALSTANLFKGLQALPLAEALLFLDACRSRPESLAGKSIHGTPILEEGQAPPRTDQVVPIVYASAAGGEAWDRDDPAEGPSVFGEALLEALRDQPNPLADCDDPVCRIWLLELAAHLTRRVPQLLKIGGARGFIRLGGVVGDPCVTELPAPPAGGPTPGPQPPGPSATVSFGLASDGDAPEPSRVAPIRAEGITPDTLEWSELHELFGHESLTDLWRAARILRLEESGAAPEIGSQIIHRIEHTGSRRLTIELSFTSRGAHWLELPTGDQVFAVVLPDDGVSHKSPRFVIDLVREDNGHLARLDGRLSMNNPGALRIAAEVWDRYDELDMAAAASVRDRAEQEGVLSEKVESSLAAVSAGLFLLRVGDFKRLHDWLRNLANWFPGIPDGPVLWAEQLLRDPHAGQWAKDPVGDAAYSIIAAGERGLPWTGEALGYMGRQLDTLVNRSAAERETAFDVRGENELALAALHEHVSQALSVFRSGGFFTSFSGPADIVRPELMLPSTGAAGASLADTKLVPG